MEKSTIKKVVSVAKKTVDNKASMQILSNVMLRGDGLYFTNLDQYLCYHCNTGINTPTTIPLAAFKTMQSIDKKDQGSWNLNYNGERLNVNDGNLDMSFDTIPAEEFPTPEKSTEYGVVYVDRADLLDTLQYVIEAVSTDVTRPHINGALMEVTSDNIMIIGTDGHRMSWDRINCITDTLFSKTIPRSAIDTIIRFCKAENNIDMVSISDLDNGMVRFNCGPWSLETTVIDHEFPPYDQVIPKNSPKVTKIKNENLMKALKAVSRISSDKTLGCKLAFDGNNVTVETEDPNIGTAKKSVKIDGTINDFVIGFNGKYIIDALKTIGGGELEFELDGVLDPMLVKRGERGAVIMPMRI